MEPKPCSPNHAILKFLSSGAIRSKTFCNKSPVTSSRIRNRPVAFGLAWFVLALLPTSFFPLAEVENDRRMFFPFIGLVLAGTGMAAG
jgi:hypothetical protein